MGHRAVVWWTVRLILTSKQGIHVHTNNLNATLPAMNERTAARIAAVFGALAVGLGAFGAHGLKGILMRNDTAGIWQTAVFYHFIHAVMLYVLSGSRPTRYGPWYSFLAGILIFSGSLYVLALTNVRWLGAITPLGGVSFIVGWLWLAICPGADRAEPAG